MEYFIIKNSTNLTEIGKWPQATLINNSLEFSEKVRKIWYVEANDYLLRSIFGNTTINAKVSNKSKLTSLIHILNASSFLVLNNDFKNLTKQFNLTANIPVPVSLFKNNQILDSEKYYWLCLLPIRYEFIDFKSSIFNWLNLQNREIIKEFKIQNEEELKLLRDNQNWDENFYPKQIYLSNKFDFDMFKFDFFDSPNIYISERLMNKIISEGFTGVEFIKPKEFNITKL